jgi:predicted anti-sigma-YlaC factor YlaD
MNERDNCREYRGFFPLYYNGSLESDLNTRLEQHLQDCRECRAAYMKELPLFAAAGARSALGDLDSHPESDVLDRWTHNPDSMTLAQKSEVETHLSQCDLCREVSEKLASLPREVEDLVVDGEIPTLTALSEGAGRSSAGSKTTNLTRRIWRPLSAIAAAAAVIIVISTMVDRDRHGPAATVEGTFPVATRSAGEPVVFDAHTEQFTFVGRLYVDPEAGHSYGLLVRDKESEDVLYRTEQLSELDTLGFARFETVLKPGRYELVLYDVSVSDPTDTIEIPTPFEIRLNR